jgi:hypothetical protein
MTNLKEKVCMVVTHGLFVSQAERLARDFKKVYLVVSWNSHSFPTVNHWAPGMGLPNVEKVKSIWGPHLEECDLIVFPDIYFSDEQIRLEKMGYRVWGGRNGEEMECYRETCKEVMEGLGLPVQPWTLVKGITALREYLKGHENQHVKLDMWRGTFETFKAETYAAVETQLDKIALKLGGMKEETEFVVEQDLPDCVEVGLDTFCIDGHYPSQTIVGIEVKDLGYVGEFKKWKDIPEPIRLWNEEMAAEFARYGYRGDVSNELRIGKDMKAYMIDATCRSPSPPGELLQEYYTNYSEIRWYGAEGIVIDPIPAGKFGVQVVMRSEFAKEEWQPVTFDEKYAKQIKLFNCCVNAKGERFVVPQSEDMGEVGAIIGWGDTLEAAIAHMQKAADSIGGFQIKIPHGSIDEAKKQMEELSEMGLDVFSVEAEPAEA